MVSTAACRIALLNSCASISSFLSQSSGMTSLYGGKCPSTSWATRTPRFAADEHLPLVDDDLHDVLAADHLEQFLKRFYGNDCRRRKRRWAVGLPSDYGKPVSVRADHLDLGGLFLGLEQDAVQRIALLLDGYGKDGFLNHLLQDRRFDFERILFREVGYVREFLFGNSHDLEAAALSLHDHGGAGDFQREAFIRRLVDDADHRVHGNDDPAGSLHFHISNEVLDADLEVGGREFQQVVHGSEMNVFENRLDVPRIHDAADNAQCVTQFRPRAGYVHFGSSPRDEVDLNIPDSSSYFKAVKLWSPFGLSR